MSALNAYTELILRHMIASRRDLFGEHCAYVRFEPENEIPPECCRRRSQPQQPSQTQQNDGDFASRDGGARTAGYNSSMVFGRVVYRARDDDSGRVRRTPPLAIKLPPSFPIFSWAHASYQFHAEAHFYSRVLPLFRSADARVVDLFPRFYDAGLRLDARPRHDDAVIVLESLRSEGYTTPPAARAFADYAHLALMMRALGRFHACSYVVRARYARPQRRTLRQLLGPLLDSNYAALGLLGGLSSRVSERGVRPLRQHWRYQRRLRKLESICGAADAFLHDVYTDGGGDSEWSVLCHGDYTLSNVLFRYADETGATPSDVKIVDPAEARVASPVVDLALVLYLNADQKQRDEHFDDLLDVYHEALAAGVHAGAGADANSSSDAGASDEAAVAVPSRQQLLNEFRGVALHAYFVATYYLVQLLASDQQLPGLHHYLPAQYRDTLIIDIPTDVYAGAMATVGGETATEALVDILKDMLDRNFI